MFKMFQRENKTASLTCSNESQEPDYKALYFKLKAEIDFQNSGEKSFNLKFDEVKELRRLILIKMEKIQESITSDFDYNKDDETEKLIKESQKQKKPLDDLKNLLQLERERKFQLFHGIYKTLNFGFDLTTDIKE
jgi:hypothetical protein